VTCRTDLPLLMGHERDERFDGVFLICSSAEDGWKETAERVDRGWMITEWETFAIDGGEAWGVRSSYSVSDWLISTLASLGAQP
jgi:hypothetical protein